MIWFLVKVLLALIVIFILLGFGRTWQMEHSVQEQAFAKGTVPNPPPDGFYAGSVPMTTSWLGKKFNMASSTGVNVFYAKDGMGGEKYPFVTSTGASLHNTAFSVLKIDYDIPSNPFWLRSILDEVVEIAPGQYLGKMNVRIIYGLPFTIGYFELKK